MMFSHFGVTGPVILSASSKLNNVKNINEKIIFVRRDQAPDINHLNQFVRSLKFLGLTITIIFYKDAVKVADIFATYHLLQKYEHK